MNTARGSLTLTLAPDVTLTSNCLAHGQRSDIEALAQCRPLIAAGPDGSKNTLWTNVTLPQFSDEDNPANATVHIFLSEYNATYVDVDERRAR